MPVCSSLPMWVLTRDNRFIVFLTVSSVSRSWPRVLLFTNCPLHRPLDKTKETRFAVDCLVCTDPAFQWATHAQFFCFQHPAKWRPVDFISILQAVSVVGSASLPATNFALWTCRIWIRLCAQFRGVLYGRHSYSICSWRWGFMNICLTRSTLFTKDSQSWLILLVCFLRTSNIMSEQHLKYNFQNRFFITFKDVTSVAETESLY